MRQRGFTLVELMVVIAIIASLAMIAYPSATKFVARDRVKRVARDTAELFNEYRNHASGSGRAIIILMKGSYAGGTQSWEVRSSNTAACSAADGYEVIDGITNAAPAVLVVPYDPELDTSDITVCLRPDGRMVRPNALIDDPIKYPIEVYVFEKGKDKSTGFLVEVPQVTPARVWGLQGAGQ